MLKRPSIEDLRERFSYDPLTGVLRARRARGIHLPALRAVGTPNAQGYLVVYAGRDAGTLLVNRVVWAMSHGEWPENPVDHRDRDPANNRLQNLRAVPHKKNQQNMRGWGVTYLHTRQKWRAQIGVDYRCVFLGEFDCLGVALRARRAGKLKHHGPESFGRASKPSLD